MKRCLRFWRIWPKIILYFMPTITIPREISSYKELIAVPRTTYREFLEWQRKMKSTKTFTPTARDKRVLARARRNFRRGNYVTLEQLKHELELDH